MQISQIASSVEHFSVNTTTLALQPGQIRSITIAFTPTSLRDYKGQLTVLSNDPLHREVQVALVGTGRDLIQPTLVLQPASVTFPAVGVGNWGMQLLTIQNLGESQLRVRNIVTDNPLFAVDVNKVNVEPLSSVQLELTFAPLQVGNFQGKLTLESNDPQRATAEVNLTGSGREKQAQTISFEPDTLQFDSVGVGRSVTRIATLRNQGEMPLLVQNIVSNNVYFQTDSTHFQILPQASRQLTVTFSPIQAQAETGKLTVFSNDPVHSEMVITLLGKGRNLLSQQVVVEPKSVVFDSTDIGNTSVQNLMIFNAGDFPLTVSNILSAASQFKVAASNFTLQGGQQRVLEVRFEPTEIGAMTSWLAVYSNDPQQPVVQVSVLGIGRVLKAQRIAVSPDRLEFGTVPLADSLNKRLWVINLGEKPLTVDSIKTRDTHFRVTPGYLQVPPTGSREVWVTFKPTNLAPINTQLRFKSDDQLNPYVNVPLTGSGRQLKQQSMTITPLILDFKALGWGHVSQKQLFVQNIGEQPLEVTGIQVSDTTHFKFSPARFSVAANQAQIVTVTFKPNPIGLDSTRHLFEAILTVTSNDTGHARVEVPLAGTGRPWLSSKLKVTPEKLNFETTAVGRSITKYLTLENQGEQTLKVRNVEITGQSFKSQFQIENKTATVVAGSSTSLKITFVPTQVDTLNTALAITSNDSAKPTVSVPVSAAAINYAGPVIVVRPARIQFGTVLKGMRRTLAAYISNAGPKALNVTSITTTNPTLFQVVNQRLTIAPGDSKLVQITFRPVAVAEYSAFLTVRSDDEYNRTLEILLTGQGVFDDLGVNILGRMSWIQRGAPFPVAFLANQNHVFFTRDFENYSVVQNVTLNLAYHAATLRVFLNGALILDNQNNSEVFRYWTRSLTNLKPYLLYGRNRLAVELVANDGQGAFDAELSINNQDVILRGDNNPGNPLAYWWYYFGNIPPAMAGNARAWYYQEYGWVTSDSLLGKWRFQEGKGDTLYDLSPRGRRAVKTTTTTWIQALNGYALAFRNNNSRVQLEANLNTTPLTVQMWFRADSFTTKNQVLFSNAANTQGGHGLSITPTAKLKVAYFNGEYEINQLIIKGKWYYLSFRIDAEHYINVYLNGKRIDRRAYPNYNVNYPTGFSYCYLGDIPTPGANTQGLIGALTEVEILNSTNVAATVPMVLMVQPKSNPAPVSRANLKVELEVTPPIASVESGQLVYLVGGARTTKKIIIPSQNQSTIAVTIPEADVTIRGLSYRLVLNTEIGQVRFPNSTDTTAMNWLVVRTTGEAAPNKTRSEIYQMFSVPYELNDQSVPTVLKDDLGNYDPFNWRLFHWNNRLGQATRYFEYGTADWPTAEKNIFTRGQAYWLVTFDANKTLDADSGYSAASTTPFNLTLRPGWNQIGNPFPFTVHWDSIPKDANISRLYYYNPETRGYELNQRQLKAWAGYFVHNNAATSFTLKVPAQASENSPAKAISTIAWNLATDQTTFALNIAASCEHFHDRDNLFVVTEGAQEQWDPNDALEAPPIGHYISLWIDHSDWQQEAGAYTIDAQPPGKPGYVWQVVLEGQAPATAAQVSLNFENLVMLPGNQEVFLFDRAADLAVNLKQAKDYIFEISTEKNWRRSFKLVTGDVAFVQQQSEGIPLENLVFELLPNYPNPFNPTTCIRFTIPRKGYTRLAIYNVLGQEVIRLADEVLRPARYQFYWHGIDQAGRPVASGMYFIQLKSMEQIQNRKIMFIK
ncbi:choice-of-anchor D domain-containing protein [candidate division KSB1 bacterium]|nr:choice-of-anchor D domain-containing protein [candidate division KSB1 bacterium]